MVDGICGLDILTDTHHTTPHSLSLSLVSGLFLNFHCTVADPFGAAKVDIYEDVKCGQLSLRPLSLDSSLSSSPSSSSPSMMSSKSDVNRNATL